MNSNSEKHDTFYKIANIVIQVARLIIDIILVFK